MMLVGPKDPLSQPLFLLQKISTSSNLQKSFNHTSSSCLAVTEYLNIDDLSNLHDGVFVSPAITNIPTFFQRTIDQTDRNNHRRSLTQSMTKLIQSVNLPTQRSTPVKNAFSQTSRRIMPLQKQQSLKTILKKDKNPFVLSRRNSLGQTLGESVISESNSPAGGTSISKKQSRVSFNPEREILKYEEDAKEKRQLPYKDVLFVSDDYLFLEDESKQRISSVSPPNKASLNKDAAIQKQFPAQNERVIQNKLPDLEDKSPYFPSSSKIDSKTEIDGTSFFNNSLNPMGDRGKLRGSGKSKDIENNLILAPALSSKEKQTNAFARKEAQLKLIMDKIQITFEPQQTKRYSMQNEKTQIASVIDAQLNTPNGSLSKKTQKSARTNSCNIFSFII